MTSPRPVSYVRTHRVVRDHRPWSHQRLAAAVGIAVGLCFVFVPQGCGGAAPALVVPDGIAGNVQACAIEHQRHVVGKDHTVTYELRLDRSGFVDDIALVDSTLGDEELEKCMASSLRSFTEDDLLLRPSPNVESERASAQSRTMVGHPGVLAACAATPPCLLTLVVLMGATAITVQIMVHAASTASKPTATTTAPPIAVPRRWPGQTCEDTELDRLQGEKNKICNNGYATSCPNDPLKFKKKEFANIPCSAIKLSILQRQACLAARWAVQNICFGGEPDDRHKKPIDDMQQGIDNCELFKLNNCAPGHPMANL